MNLNQTIAELIVREGGYSNNPNDSGGETMYGITAAVARAYGYSGLMSEMPRTVAEDIYAKRYWFQPNLNFINQITPAVAEEMLDTGVNMGPAVAGKFLQRSLNVLNKNAKLFPDLMPDGNVGPMTIDALNQFVLGRGVKGITVLLRMLNALQGAKYIELAEQRPKDEAFVFGWLDNRVS